MRIPTVGPQAQVPTEERAATGFCGARTQRCGPGVRGNLKRVEARGKVGNTKPASGGLDISVFYCDGKPVFKQDWNVAVCLVLEPEL